MIFLPGEAKRFKAFYQKIAPISLLVVVIFFLGYTTGNHVAKQDISLDCKYANAFRANSDSFTCNKKI